MRSRRLATLERLAGMTERAARLRLARANQDLQRKLGQQAQLESYDAEYATRWLESGRAGLGGRRLMELASFRQGLARTLQAQAIAVGNARAVLGQEGARWSLERERLRVFGQLVESARKHEEQEAEKRRQHALDDLSARSRRVD